MCVLRMENNHFCFERTCTASGKSCYVLTKPVGSGLDGSEPASRQIGHGPDGMNQER